MHPILSKRRGLLSRYDALADNAAFPTTTTLLPQKIRNFPGSLRSLKTAPDIKHCHRLYIPQTSLELQPRIRQAAVFTVIHAGSRFPGWALIVPSQDAEAIDQKICLLPVTCN